MIMISLIAQVYGVWPMWGGEPSHQSFQTMRGAMTITPVVKWRFATRSSVEWQFSAVADCDRDGQMEVLMGSYDNKLYCLRGTDGTQKWVFTTGNNIHSAPAVGDCDGDGWMEVIVCSYDTKVYCLRGTDGTQKWSFTTGAYIHSSPTIADCDGDGQKEVIVGNDNGDVYCLAGTNGTQKWVFSGYGDVYSSPAVADCDGDGKMEVVFGYHNNPGPEWPNLYCLRGSNGTEKWSVTGYPVQSSPVVADVDGDGRKEVIFGTSGTYDYRVYCLRGSDGVIKWSYPANARITSSPAVADCDGDGQMEIYIGTKHNLSMNSRVYCLRGSDGTLRWQYTTFSHPHTPGSLADVDGDGKLEFLVPQIYSDTLYCFNAENGTVLWRKALAYDVHTPIPADIDGDGCIEIVVGTQNPDAEGYYIFALDDPANTQGCGPIGMEEGMPGAGLEFRAAGGDIYLFLPEQANISLFVYDVSGKPVQSLYEGVMGSGVHTFAPDIRARGIYLAVLRYNEKSKTIKLLVR